MWHGASWNFIIWGVFFGVIVMLEKYTLLRIKQYVPSVLLHVYSLALVVIGWGIFYFDDFQQMKGFFHTLFGDASAFHDFVTVSALVDNFWLWVVAMLFCMPLRSTVSQLTERWIGSDNWVGAAVVTTSKVVVSAFLLILSVSLLVGATNNAFIYTRF